MKQIILMLKITKSSIEIILINMKNFLSGLFDCVKRKKGYFIILILFSLLAIILGVIAAIKFGGGVFAVDLSNIAYIRFLKGDCGFMSMFLGLILSLLVFFIFCLACHYKAWLLPLGFLFYLYLVYSQAVVFMSVILIYGILNCIILVVLLLIYSLIVWCLFLLMLCEISCFTNQNGYFKTCFSFKESKTLFLLISLLILTFVFSLILVILKNYVVLLIF